MRASTLLSLALPLTSSVAFAQTPAPPVAVPATPQLPLPTNEPPVDYPFAVWTPAADGNFDPENRPETEKIDMIIVHDIEGPAAAGVNIFQGKGANVSAHYIVDPEGKVFQLVREHNVGWHAGNRSVNHRSIGIETEGYAYQPGWYSPKTYEGEARLVRDITQRYNIPRDRTHIIGHAEVPNPRDPTKFGGANGHTDPGPYWDWSTFMTLVRSDSQLKSAQIPTVIRPGEKLPATVTLQNTGDDPWAANTAKNPRTGLQASAPVVFLGTPLGTPSAFSSLTGWMSGQYADVVKTADVAPGATARFDFVIQGPRTLGDVSEELRATYVPTAAQGSKPIPFGATVPLKLNVIPWDITVAAPDPLAPSVAPSATAPGTAPGTAPLLSIAPDGTIKNAAPLAPPVPLPVGPPPVASWTAKLPVGGIWGVFVSPAKPEKVRKNDAFSYGMTRMLDGAGPMNVEAKKAGKGFVFGGYYRFAETTTKSPAVTVTLDKAPQGITAANAGSLRFVGPYPTLPQDMPVLSESAS